MKSLADRVVRKRLADGTVKEYRYARRKADKAPRYATDSIDALLEAWRRSPQWAALSPKTQINYSIYVRPLYRIGQVRVRDLSRRLILDIRDAIATKRGNGAATGFTRATSAALAWGVDRGWLDYNPALRIKSIARGHLPAWTEAEVATALAGLSEPLRRVAVLAMHTGQRRGDLIRLPWTAYNGATIRLTQEKTAAPLVLPVHADLRAELEAWRAERKAVVILTNHRGQPWTPEHLSRAMGKALAVLGLPGRNVHGLRKLAATRLAEAGASVHEIAAVTGHKSLSMVALYTASAEQERLARAAVTRLETARRQPPKTAS